MNKIFLFIILFSSLFSQTIKFRELKHISALEAEFKKTGYINFQKDFIETSYDNSDEVLFFQDDTLLIKEKDKLLKTIDLNQDMAKKIYYNILKSIYLDDLSSLELYFTVKKENGKIFLLPKSTIRNYLKDIEIKKKDKKLDFLIIHKPNKDWIRIEQLD